MAKCFLLPCECNHKLSVETRNAGSTIECPQCSATLDVPKLRELKNLEPAIQDQGTGQSRAANPVKRHLFTLGLGIAVIAGLAGGALYKYSSNMINKDQQTRDEIAEFEKADAFLKEAPLAQVWDIWHDNIDDIDLPEWKEATWNTNLAQGTILKNFSYGILGLAGIGLLLTLSSFLISNKRS